MDDLKTIKLLGAAGRKFGRSFQLAVKSPAEAVRALLVLFPDFHAWVIEQHERGVAWRVVTDTPTGVSADELTMETGAETITLAPVLLGSGGEGMGIGAIVLGIALIAASIFIPGSAMIFGTAFGKISLAIGLLGGSLALAGVAQLVTPTPTLSGAGLGKVGDGGVEGAKSADLQSNLFSRNQGTGGQGECVPLLYGRRRVQSPRLISFDLRNLPASRSITTTGTSGLLGYVNRVTLT